MLVHLKCLILWVVAYLKGIILTEYHHNLISGTPSPQIGQSWCQIKEVSIRGKISILASFMIPLVIRAPCLISMYLGLLGGYEIIICRLRGSGGTGTGRLARRLVESSLLYSQRTEEAPMNWFIYGSSGSSDRPLCSSSPLCPGNHLLTTLITESGRAPGEGNGNHCSILAWETPRTQEPGGLQPTGSQSWTWLSN